MLVRVPFREPLMFVRLVPGFVVAVAVVSALAGCPKPIDTTPDAGPTGPTLQTCNAVEDCDQFVEGAATQIVRCDGVCRVICNGVDEACPPQFFCGTDGTCAIGCRDSSECAADELCSGGECAAGGGEECTTKCDCEPGEVCTNGQCVAAGSTCSSGADCPRGPRTPADDCEAFQCNGFSDQCFDPSPTPCTAAGDCIGRPGCTGGSVCACTSSGACVPDVACTPQTEATACGAENFCDGNGDCQARPTCANDGECSGFGLTCNEGAGRCERAQACTISQDCTTAPNTFCAQGFCTLPTCNNGAVTCNADQDCSADGRCVTAGTGTACTGDASCQNNQFCNFTLSPAQCSVGCRNNGSCAIDQSCNGAHQCVANGGGGGGGFGESCPNGDADCQAPMICGGFTQTCAETCGTDADCVACAATSGGAGCTCGAFFPGFCVPN